MSSEISTTTGPLARPQSAQVANFDTSILAGQLAPSSLKMYARDFQAYGDWARGMGLDPLAPATLSRWRAYLANETEHSPNTINRMLSAVKRLMREAAQQGYLDHAQAEAFQHVGGVKTNALRGRTKKNARTRIEPADMRALVNAADQSTLKGKRDAALLTTMASSGLRAAEVAGLKMADVFSKAEGCYVAVLGKGQDEPRDAPLSREAYTLIMQWLAVRGVESEYVFNSFGGRGGRVESTPLTPASVWRVVQEYAKGLGLEHIKPHDFRRFVGTQLAKDDLRKAQKALGHKLINTTAKHYVIDDLELGMTDHLF